jgi:hypothetical protein
MFVITADQIDSRRHADAAGGTRDRINAGDEIQMLTDDSAGALAIVLELTRTREWSVGLGCGSIRLPLPEATREASGAAFFAARDAVLQAKKRQTRFAFASQTDDAESSTPASDIEALIDLLLLLRDRRTTPGWELFDLMAEGLSQQDAAERLGISAPSASSRARAANIRAEFSAVPALSKLMHDLDSRLTA